MNDADPKPSMARIAALDPQVRYSLRKLLMTTTVAALFAAALTPLFRAQSEIGQRQLLIEWSAALVCMGAFYSWDLVKTSRDFLRARTTVGSDYRFQLQTVGPFANVGNPKIRVILRSVVGVCMVLAISTFIAPGNQNLPRRASNWSFYCFFGLYLGWILRAIFWKREGATAYLCDRGIHMEWRNRCIPWHDIRDAQWLSRRPSVLQLRNYNYNKVIVLETPIAIRGEVEAFVTERLTSADFP